MKNSIFNIQNDLVAKNLVLQALLLLRSQQLQKAQKQAAKNNIFMQNKTPISHLEKGVLFTFSPQLTHFIYISSVFSFFTNSISNNITIYK